MNWITRWKKIGIKVKQIFKKQPEGQEVTDWKNCPQCKKISYKPDLFNNSHDMLYYISMLSTTGEKLKVSPREILKNYDKIKKIIKNRKKNIVIGFGITSKNIASFKKADGCVVGSEICKKISKSIKNRQNPVTNVSNMVKSLKSKIA